MPTQAEQIQQFTERIAPHMQELGIEAFVLCAYVINGDGKVSRVTMGTEGHNPAYGDGLKIIRSLASKWGEGQLS